MFFPKLRKRAKWVFLFLAIIFAASFVFFGVGAGGSGIGDFLSDFIHNEPATGTPSLDDARDEVADNPKNAQAQLDLARAAQAEGEIPEAVSAYEAYLALKPDDSDAMRGLVALYGRQIADAQERASIANGQAAEASLPNTLAPSDSEFLQALTENSLTGAVSAKAQARANAANAEVQRLAQLQVGVFEDLTLLVKDDPLVWLQFAGAAEQAQDYDSAVTAYETYLDLQPNSPQADQIEERVKTLKAIAGATPPDDSTGGSDGGG
jgi:tetratricopeptide (TPR) repeat protein